MWVVPIAVGAAARAVYRREMRNIRNAEIVKKLKPL